MGLCWCALLQANQKRLRAADLEKHASRLEVAALVMHVAANSCEIRQRMRRQNPDCIQNNGIYTCESPWSRIR